MGPPAAFAIGLMVGSNNTLVSLGLRGTYISIFFKFNGSPSHFAGNGFNDKSVEPLAELIKV